MASRSKVSFDYPNRIRFQCIRCALCCGDTKTRVRRILLLKNEAERISEGTSKPITEFAFRVDHREPYAFEMIKTDNDGKCFFLRDKTCSVYALRPLVCRFYPFQLGIAEGGKYKFSHSEECPGIGEGRQLKERFFEDLFQNARVQLDERNSGKQTNRPRD